MRPSSAGLSIKRPLAPDELFARGMVLANSEQPKEARDILNQAIITGLYAADTVQAKAALSKPDQPGENK